MLHLEIDDCRAWKGQARPIEQGGTLDSIWQVNVNTQMIAQLLLNIQTTSLEPKNHVEA